MAGTTRLIRIDPVQQKITTMRIRLATKPVGDFKRLLCAPDTIGERTLMPMKPAPLMVAACNDLPAASAKWRLKGGEDTAGRGLLYGNQPPSKARSGGIVDCPVDVAWLEARIVWTPEETDEQCAERARDMVLPLLNDELRAAIAAAHVTPAGEMWLSVEDKAAFGTALASLDLVGEGVRAQRLNRLGQAVHDLLLGEPA